jgi:hypothetical protein
MLLFSLIFTFILFTTETWAKSQLAFPDAEGFGRFAQGGRQGTSFVVHSLADSGPGTLRDALSQEGRIVTFNVSGIIQINKRLVVPKYTTILGQTAPGVGITVYGNGWSFSNSHESIIRWIRIRMGVAGDHGKDAMTVAQGHNMIFDHISASWGRDETFSINEKHTGDVQNITIQNCIVAQGLETHSAGGLIQSVGGISIFRTFYTDNKTRNPKVKGKNNFVNNVVYNWGGGGGYIAGGDSAGQTQANIVGNYFIAGPSTGKTKAFVRGNENFHASVRGNFVDHDVDGVLNGKELAAEKDAYGGMNLSTQDFGYSGPQKVLSAVDAVKEVIRSAGASKVRDSVDELLIKELQSWGKSGKLIHSESDTAWNGPKKEKPEGDGGKKQKGNVVDLGDQDADGIPDYYERMRGWDIYSADSMIIEESGYTRIEEYANSLVEQRHYWEELNGVELN